MNKQNEVALDALSLKTGSYKRKTDGSFVILSSNYGVVGVKPLQAPYTLIYRRGRNPFILRKATFDGSVIRGYKMDFRTMLIELDWFTLEGFLHDSALRLKNLSDSQQDIVLYPEQFSSHLDLLKALYKLLKQWSPDD
ncbi:hypothetical protein [Shewanella fodinae]|uniref:hypothetical protein n=1 Tax=Shewanella fodinae TaxID=552357 RepID=UPI001678F681|nr:hypothetical protein [Shewanella fodinae]MCL2908093.1 hypothetical protein [Shewanella fodinae]GGZ01161.1 hypothetical protein GCM10007169_17420 [Shewanella fodinae]